ncbi:hypothetical protein ACS8Y6_07615 [Salinisphaera sp. RV14]
MSAAAPRENTDIILDKPPVERRATIPIKPCLPVRTFRAVKRLSQRP